MNISVVIADDHPMLRDGLRLLLERQAGIQVVGEAADGRSAVALVRRVAPSVVVMDVSMPGLNGVEATRILHASVPETKVLALSAHANKTLIINMLAAGAVGYLLKVSAFEELVGALQTVMAGQCYLSPRIAGLLINDYLDRRTADKHSPFILLTTREREILQLLAEGHTSKTIADLLHITPKAIDSHRVHLMETLQLHNTSELVRYAIREGLTTLEG